MKYVVTFVVALMLVGCVSKDAKTVEVNKRKSVINSCFTVLESNNKDKWDRINSYLDARIKGGYVTAKEAEVILECLRRASGSKK
jgi:hypothetical protein